MTISQDVEQEDMLSKLPDDIIDFILKRLDIRDAVRCSVLSRRWRHIPNVLSDIVLDVDSFEFEVNHDDGSTSTLSDEAMMSNMAVARAAKSVLTRRSDIPITNLSLTFYLREDSIDIIRDVEEAMSDRGRGVVAAEFNIVCEVLDFTCNNEELVTQGRLFLSYFNTCPRVFAGLTGLHVESVKLREADIVDVLCTCQKLVWLTLRSCKTGRESALILEHPQLTELSIEACNFDGVELKWLPKLSHVTCEDWRASRNGCPLLFGHIPNLSWLMLATAGYFHYSTIKLSRLLINCAKLSELHLDFASYRIWVVPEGPRRLGPLLRNLRIVNLENIFEKCDLIWTLFLVQAAPLLNALHIKVSNHMCEPMDPMPKHLRGLRCKKDNMMTKEYYDFKHNNLTLLNIIGFQQKVQFMTYLWQIKKVALNLKLIDLLDDWCPNCEAHPVTKYPRTKEERDHIRKQVNEEITAVQFYNRSSDGTPIIVID